MDGVFYDLCMAIRFIFDDHHFVIINTGQTMEYLFDGNYWFSTSSVLPSQEAIDLGIQCYTEVGEEEFVTQ